jgi:hypothetical protein
MIYVLPSNNTHLIAIQGQALQLRVINNEFPSRPV